MRRRCEATRSRVARGAALAFLIWHGVAITVGPYPDSEVSQMLRPLFEPYLRIAYLDHAWTFFGPQPDAGRLVRYELILRDGTVREYPLSETIDRRSRLWFRWMRMFDRVSSGDHELRSGAMNYLCRRHAELEPRTVRLVVLRQLALSSELYRAGVRPTDAEALRRSPGGDVTCGSTPERSPG